MTVKNGSDNGTEGDEKTESDESIIQKADKQIYESMQCADQIMKVFIGAGIDKEKFMTALPALLMETFHSFDDAHRLVQCNIWNELMKVLTVLYLMDTSEHALAKNSGEEKPSATSLNGIA